MTNAIYDFAIIGAGIGGVSLGYELARAGATVLVLEQEAVPAFHTTGRSAAMYARGYGNHAVRALTTASSDFYFSPQSGFDRAPMIGPAVGCLFVARDDQLEALDEHRKTLAQDVDDVRFVSVDEACEWVPVLNREYVKGAVFEPHSATLDVNEIHGNYLRAAKALGVRLEVNACLMSAQQAGDHVWMIETSAGTFRSRKLVNAAGAWADEVAQKSGVDPVGIQPMRRTAMIFDAPSGVTVNDWPLLLDVDDQFYFKSEGGRVLASPCDETPMPAHDAAPDEMDVAICADRVMRATTMQITHISHKWAGLRSFAPDRSPVIGPDPLNPDFIWMAGQGGYGIQMGPALARACAGLALLNKVPDDIIETGLDPNDVMANRLRA